MKRDTDVAKSAQAHRFMHAAAAGRKNQDQ